MKYKAILSDFDGTLIDRNDTISSKVQDSISLWLSKGNIFSICTGRQFLHIQDAAKLLKLTSPQIVRGGSEIVNPLDGKVIYSEYIDPVELRDLISILKESPIPFTAEQNNILYTLTGEPSANVIGVKYEKISSMTFKDVAKVVLWTDSLDEAYVEDFVKKNIEMKFSSLHAIKAYTPFKKAWDITSVKATKAIAVVKLSELLHISPLEIVGIGDGYNDYPLLSACGYKIAMGNAHPELKAIADYIAPSYEEDGVADSINHILKLSST